MHTLASFDRWFVVRASQSTPAHDADRQLRAAVGARADDWLGLLADDSQSRGSGFAWRLALWPQGGEPRWLSPPLRARAGETAARLRTQALQQALQALSRR